MKATDVSNWALLLGIGVPWIIIILFLVLILKNTSNLFLWASKIQSFFTWCSSSARKGTISNKIRANVLKANKVIGKLDEDVLPKDLKIEWTMDETKESFMKNNQAIIRMKNSTNPYINFVTAVSGYVNTGFLSKYRNYISPDVLKASDLSMIRKLIINSYDNAVSYFDSNILDPLLVSDGELRELIETIRTIDGNGMFIGILVKEFAKASRKLYPERADPCLLAETKELLRFLNLIAMGISKNKDDLALKCTYFNIDVFLAASSQTLNYIGKEEYIKVILRSISSGIETLYIFGLGLKINLAKELAQEIQKREIKVNDNDITYHYYKHINHSNRKRVNGICIEINIEQQQNSLG